MQIYDNLRLPTKTYICDLKVMKTINAMA